MSATVTIKNAFLFDPGSGLGEKGSVIIENGKIADILKGKNGDSGKIYDLQGKHLCPGFVDLHCQLGEPGSEQKENIKSGSRAAAAGGFTTVCVMPQTQPVNDSGFVSQYIMEKIRTQSVIRVHPIGAISQKLQGTAMADIDSMVKAGCVALSDGKQSVMNAYLLRKTMEYLKTYDIPLVEHCEDVNLVGKGVMNEGLVSSQIGLRGIPHAAEDVIVSRDISLGAHTDARLHLAHLSSKGSVEILAHAKARGLKVTAEVAAHQLLLTDEELRSYNTSFKLSPPLRTEQDRKALVDALRSGVIDCIVSDHTPHSEEDKDVEFENAQCGASSFETVFAICMELVNKKELSLERVVESLTAAPSKIFKFKDRGQIKIGMWADFAVFDIGLSWTIDSDRFFSKSKYTPFNQKKVTGKVIATYVGGEEVFNLERGILN